MQALGAITAFAWAFGLGMILFLGIKHTTGLRVSEEEELRGLDIGEHGMEAYSGFQVFTTHCLLGTTISYAGFGIGTDVYSRYVWRGTDFGNSASIQPALTYSIGGLEVGAWASYPIASDVTSIGSNENDLYISYSIGDLGLTLTDYYFPEGGEVFNYSSDDGFHFIEASASYAIGPMSLLAGYFFSGDADNSMYAELGYGFYESDDMSASLTIGAGDGMYVLEDDLGMVNVGLTVSSGSMSVSYIINPDAETNFLVVGYSF